MYIAMNRFKIAIGQEETFEEIWKTRESNLSQSGGFNAFHLLRGPTEEGSHTLFATHVIWDDQASFEAWTRSEQFRQSHAKAGTHRDIYLGHPQFEGFEVVLEESNQP